jgi:hypothetical protein
VDMLQAFGHSMATVLASFGRLRLGLHLGPFVSDSPRSLLLDLVEYLPCCYT